MKGDTALIHARAYALSAQSCRGDKEVGQFKREYKYSRYNGRKRHAQDQHLTERAAGEGFDCPYKG